MLLIISYLFSLSSWADESAAYVPQKGVCVIRDAKTGSRFVKAYSESGSVVLHFCTGNDSDTLTGCRKIFEGSEVEMHRRVFQRYFDLKRSKESYKFLAYAGISLGSSYWVRVALGLAKSGLKVEDQLMQMHEVREALSEFKKGNFLNYDRKMAEIVAKKKDKGLAEIEDVLEEFSCGRHSLVKAPPKMSVTPSLEGIASYPLAKLTGIVSQMMIKSLSKKKDPDKMSEGEKQELANSNAIAVKYKAYKACEAQALLSITNAPVKDQEEREMDSRRFSGLSNMIAMGEVHHRRTEIFDFESVQKCMRLNGDAFVRVTLVPNLDPQEYPKLRGGKTAGMIRCRDMNAYLEYKPKFASCPVDPDFSLKGTSDTKQANYLQNLSTVKKNAAELCLKKLNNGELNPNLAAPPQVDQGAAPID